MRNKLRSASALAVAATVMTALFSAEGSGAAAQDKLPEITGTRPAVEFVSVPVIQTLPTETEATDDPSLADEAEVAEVDAAATAASLAELVAAQPVTGRLSRQMRCLAGAIYFEARGETLHGQLAVGRVITQRAGSDRFPDSYCGVVYQRGQFSFVRGNRMPTVREDSRAWRNAIAIARIAARGSWDSPVEGALFFHASRISPGWRLQRLARVDNHVFYR